MSFCHIEITQFQTHKPIKIYVSTHSHNTAMCRSNLLKINSIWHFFPTWCSSILKCTEGKLTKNISKIKLKIRKKHSHPNGEVWNRHWWNVHITLTYSIHFNLAFRKCVKRIFGWNHECISIEIEMEVEWEISCLLDISLRLSSTLYNVQNMVNNFPTLFQLTSTWLSLNEMTVPFCYIKHFVAIRMEKR